MRVPLGVLLAASLVLGGVFPATASCAPPVSVAENAARAVAVVTGTVTTVDGGAMTIRIARVLKGDVRTPLRVFVGPARGGISSVDYAATAGSDHVLYLTRGTDGELETNACGGSHPGRPTDNETALFGAGTTPAAQPDGTGTWAYWALFATVGSTILLLARRAIARRRSAGAP